MPRFFSLCSLSLLLAAPGVHGAAPAQAPADPSHAIGVQTRDLAPGILARRTVLMKQGMAGLVAGNTSAAVTAFETAVSMAHAPDAELGLVRSYLQAGNYRQALAYSAHTAGAHKEEPEGTVLYVWLLHLGGQEAAAKRILHEARSRLPGNAALERVQRKLDDSAGPSSGTSGVAGAFAPYSLPPLTEAAAALSGSGVLIDGGRRVLAPLAAVAHARKIWVRNGLGHLRKAAIETRFDKYGMALLKLDQSLPLTAGLMAASKDPFPGSVVYAVAYATVGGAEADWPVMRHGFLGIPKGNGTDWELGITMPAGPHGGPVFDASGALAGISMSTPIGKPTFVPISRIRQLTGDRLGSAAPAEKGPRMAMEQVYEKAMGAAVQVLMAR